MGEIVGAIRIDKNATEILLKVKEELRGAGISSPNFSDAIRALHVRSRGIEDGT